MIGRRQILQGMGGAAALGASGVLARAAVAAKAPLVSGLPAGVYDAATLAALPGKKPLIKLADRPPNYETPAAYFTTPVTPNDAFFVRYHLADIPETIDADSWTLRVGGDGATGALEFGLRDLQSGFEQVEFAAVCQCSGNRRGLSEPHVPGVQWGVGAMGCAVWKGVRLKDVLAKAGLRKEAVEVVVDGADGPVVDKTPDFVKSIPLWKAMDENTIIATAMNGAPLPHFNGFPARLIVPGWTATYWMKHLTSVMVSSQPFDGFWVMSAYRIPTGKFPVVQHFETQVTAANEPITEMVVNSLIAAPAQDHKLRVGEAVEVKGVAWDAGYGIRRVEVTSDGGRTWREATLGKDHGRFAFRPWSYRFAAAKPGRYTILVRASNAIGQTQAEALIFNPAGYHNNVMRPLNLVVA
ncbi:MAG TPA: molybdopterin-dependent oxidoreductase [Stellaceae bacterium]|nr:molybdopterin-dependent oxidoreductase [Stellaceae bacterium]